MLTNKTILNAIKIIVTLDFVVAIVYMLIFRQNPPWAMWSLAVFACFLIVFTVTRFIILKMEGKITIELEKDNFSRGETITGKVILALKKKINADELTIGLICTKIVTTSPNPPNRAMAFEIFNSSVKIDGKKTYEGEKTYEFKIEVPSDVQPSGSPVPMQNYIIRWKIVSVLNNMATVAEFNLSGKKIIKIS